MPIRKRGFDVAEFNTSPKAIPWHTRQFACVRATTGLRRDKLVDEHLRRASGAGVVLLLLYGYLQGVHEGRTQAEFLLEHARQLEDVEHLGPLALAVDVEDPFKGPPWQRDKYARILFDFVTHLLEHAPTRLPALYVSPAFWTQLAPYLGAERLAVVTSLPLWLADWTPPADLPKGWDRWAIWQDEVKEVAPGVAIDHDIFEGTAEDWRRIFHPTIGIDPLGPLLTSIDRAEGHGPGGVADFESHDEGPLVKP